MSYFLLAVALGAEITVDTTSDVTADDGACSLREALASARDDTTSGATAGECAAGDSGQDTVVVPAGTYVLTGPLAVDSEVVVQGAGPDLTVVDAAQLGRAIEVTVVSELEGMTVQNGKMSGGQGGGIRSLVDLTLTDVTLSGHDVSGSATALGGALYVVGDLTMSRVEISDILVDGNSNNATVGGGIFIDGDLVGSEVRIADIDCSPTGRGSSGCGIYSVSGDVTLTDFEITALDSNDGQIREGGAVYLYDGDLELRRGAIWALDGSGHGQITIIEHGTEITLSNVTMADNTDAEVEIYLESGETEIFVDHTTMVGSDQDFIEAEGTSYMYLSNVVVSGFRDACDSVDFVLRGTNVLPTDMFDDCDDVQGTAATLTDDPGLDVLLDDGVERPTVPPVVDSVLIGTSDCLDTDGGPVIEDARGVARPSSGCTVGAHEYASCGDGYVRGAEGCDDGNLVDGDGCDAACVVEDEWSCFEEPSVCLDSSTDADRDGWGDDLEVQCGTDPDDDDDTPSDLDADGLCDVVDDDDDGDGWQDVLETLCGTDVVDSASVPADNDGDGVCDDLDGDDDDDGWADDLELLCGTDETDDTSVPTDTDNDDVCDVLDDDADGDGVHALTEAACGSDDLDAADVPGDSDGDGACDALDPCPDDVLDDSDSDGTCDSVDLCTGDDTTGDADGDGTCADGDCDDDDDTRYPGAMDACDGVDSDCDGSDEVDGDNDGALSCIDCDDDDDTRYPGAFEADGDGIDSNCDGFERCFTDEDDDGARTTTVVISTDTTCATTGLALADAPYDCDDDDDTLEQLDLDLDGWSTCAGDCDDDDDTLVSCDDLHLSDASLPVASQATEFTLFGADPLAEVVLVRGRLGEVTSLTKCAMDIPLGDAVIARRWDADAAGEAVIPKQMPPNPGLNGYMAVDPVACTVSNVITQQVHDDGL